MDQIADIPVKDPNGKLIGKARIERRDDDYVAHINLDHELGGHMVKAMTEGVVTGLSVGTEITPVMKTPSAQFNTGIFEIDPNLDMTKVVGRVFEIAEPVPFGQYGDKEIETRFGFHKASIEGPNATAPIHASLREEFGRFAKWLDKTLPGGREKELAFDFLESGAMWAHKSIARVSSRTKR